MTKSQVRSLIKYNSKTGAFKRLTKSGEWVSSGWNMVNGYRAIMLAGKQTYEHRAAFLYMLGFVPKEVDHINGNPRDNRWVNLRPITSAQNKFNSKIFSTNTSGYRGVSYAKHARRYRAALNSRVNGKPMIKHLGYFDTAEEAHRAYRDAVVKKYGNFLRKSSD